MVMRLYDHFHANPAWKEFRRATTSFVLLDTNVHDLGKAASRGDILTLQLSSTSGAELDAIQRSKDPFFAQWCDVGLVRASIEGAGQIRMEARTKLYVAEPAVRQTLRQALDKVLGESNVFLRVENRIVEVFVFGTLGGGTCSGTFLPMAYLLRDEIGRRQWKPVVRGYFVHAEGVTGRVGNLDQFVLANSYAAIKELEHLTATQYTGKPAPFAWRRPTGLEEVPTVARGPYDWICLADTPERELDAVDQLDHALADSAYIHLVSPAGAAVAGAADNYTRFQTTLQGRLEAKGTGTPDGTLRDGMRYTAHWGTQGASALRFPAADFALYCAERWVAATLRQHFGSASDSRAELPRDVFSDAEIRLLQAKAWLDGLEQRAEGQWRRIVDERRRRNLGEPTDPPGLVGIVQRVTGRAIGQPAVVAAPVSLDDLAALDPTAATGQPGDPPKPVPVLQRVLEDFLIGPARKGTRALPPSSGLSAKDLEQAWARMTQLDADYNGVSKANDEARTRMTARMERGEWVPDLLAQLGPTGALDATGLRYLFLRLRTGSPGVALGEEGAWQGIDAAVAARRQRIQDLAVQSFATTADEMERAVRERFKAVEDGVRQERATGWFTRLGRSVTRSDGFDFHGAKQALDGTIQRWCTDTDTYERLLSEVAVLEATAKFLDQRLQNYLTAGAEAVQQAAALDARARARMEGGQRVEKPFTIGAEALQPLGAPPSRRLWSACYEDVVEDSLRGALADEVVGAVLDEAIREDEATGGFSAGRAVAKIAERLQTLIEGPARDAVYGTGAGGGLRLDRVLFREALYAQLDPATLARSGHVGAASLTRFEQAQAAAAGLQLTRADAVAALEKAFAEPTHARHVDVHTHVTTYLRGKLRAVAELSMTLARIDGVSEANPDLQMAIAVIDDAVRLGLQSLLPADFRWKSLLGPRQATQTLDGDGLQAWDDVHTIFFFQARGMLPVYRFPSLGVAYDAYSGLMTGTGPWQKPHALHIDRQWERTLPEVDPRWWQARAVAHKRAVGLLARGLLAGRVHRPTDAAHWRVELGSKVTVLTGEDVQLIPAFKRWLEEAVAREHAFTDDLGERPRLQRARADASHKRLADAWRTEAPDDALLGHLVSDVLKPALR